MTPRWYLVTLLSIVLVVAGCIGPVDDAQEHVTEPPAPVLRTATDSMSASISGPQLHLETVVLAGPWHLEVPETIESLEAEARWQGDVHDLELRVTGPTGGSVSLPKDDGRAVYAPERPTAGTYVFEIIGEGLILEDSVDMDLSWSWIEYPDPGAKLDEVTLSQGAVRLDRTSDGWRATIVHTANSEVDDLLSVDVSTFNGPLTVERSSGRTATATLTATATAATEERATELVRGITVSLGMTKDTLKAHAKNNNPDQANRENSGASLVLEVPKGIKGEMRTSNGKISFERVDLNGLKARTSNGAVDFDRVKTSGLDIDTSNGRITGSLEASGDVKIRTSNGRIDLAFTPTDALTLDLRTSNGKVDLRLNEGSEIGYRLETRTSNGKITEDMKEAGLSGDKDSEKRLETSGYTTKTHKVGGEVRTSNGKVHFAGY